MPRIAALATRTADEKKLAHLIQPAWNLN